MAEEYGSNSFNEIILGMQCTLMVHGAAGHGFTTECLLALATFLGINFGRREVSESCMDGLGAIERES